MSGFEGAGKLLIVAGVLLIPAGLLFAFWHKIPLLGKLPGDIAIQKGSFHFFFPLVTCLTISLIVTVMLNLVFKLFK